MGKKEEEEKSEQGEEQKEAPATESKEGSAVTQMKRGDYMIHLYIEQAKNIFMEENSTVDPIVQATVLGTNQYTTAKDDINATGIAVWNEHLFFEFKNQEPEQLEKGKIELKMKDKGFLKDEMLGYYEFDLNAIYLMEQHALMHKWVILSNPESDDFSKVTGYLKLSITICGAGDEQVAIVDDPNPETESIIQPPQIKPKFFQLHYRFFGAQKIVPMDGGIIGDKKIDAYIRFDYRGRKLKTKVEVQPEGGTIHWNQEFLVPASVPLMGGRHVFKVFDEDLVLDEVVGSIHLEAKDVMGPDNGKTYWANIYGSPQDTSGRFTDLMNNNPEMGSLWKGRVLIQVMAHETEKPLLKVQDIPPEEVEKVMDFYQPNTFSMMAQINACLGLPEEKEQYQVKIRVAEFEISTGPPQICKRGYNRYNFRTDLKTEFEMPYRFLKTLETVYIYLVHDKKHICYWKGKITDFLDPNPKIQWLEFLPDKALGKVTQAHKAGLVGCMMSFHDVSANGPINWLDYPTWEKKVKRRPGNLKARAYLFQCRDLPAADEDGTSDPFLQITDCEEPKKTKVIEDNLNPLFYEALDMVYECNSIEEMPPFIIDAYDEDQNLVGKNDQEFLARSIIYLKDAAYSEGNTILKPKWHAMRTNSKGPMSGEVLVSFSIVEQDFTFARTLDYIKLEDNVPMKEFMVSLNILGLRGLASPGILPVKKAFIQFNLKSMVPPSLGQALENIKTDPKSPGPDPTLNVLLTFSAPLPTEELFCPRLSCQVYDQIFKGWNQPIIGNFTIPIGDLMHELIEERQRETAALEKVVNKLKAMVNGEEAVDVANYQRLGAGALFNIDQSKQEKKQKDAYMKEVKKSNAALSSNSAISINASLVADTSPLLGDDHDEEIRMAGAVYEREQNAREGKAKRIDVEEIVEETKQNNYRRMTKIGGEFYSEPDKSSVSGAQKIHLTAEQKKEALQQEKEAQEKAKRDAKQERSKDMEEYKGDQGGKNKSTSNIIMPVYEFDDLMSVDKEVKPPPSSVFMGLGWDEDSTTKRRHYRRFYPDELENVKEVLPVASPFQSYDIKRGQTRGAKAGLWASLTNNVKTDESGEVSSEKIMGRFKSVIEVEAKPDKAAYFEKKHQLIEDMKTQLSILARNRGLQHFNLDLEKLDTLEGREELEMMMDPLNVRHLKITKKLADIESEIILQRMLLQKNKCIVRFYAINGYDFASRDIGGASDPYLKIRCGDQKISDRDNYILDEPNPEFNKHWDFQVVFPGCPPLIIDAMDYDDLFGDDLIGSTWVDLEDRYFLPEWQALKDKPIEFRQLYHPSSQVSQGVLRMWVEINPAKVPKEAEAPIWDIAQKPPETFEVRLVVYDTLDVVAMDDEGTSDVFFRCFFDSRKDALETDCHYRCQNGKASFNYRLLYHIEHPRKDYRLTIQAYDRDFFKSNDIIGAHIIDLKQLFEDAALTHRPLSLNKQYYEAYMVPKGIKWEWKDDNSFYLPLVSKKDGKDVVQGKVRIQVDIVDAEYAEKNKVGSGRDDPNHSPFLPKPTGRLSLSLNPFSMFNQMVGPALRRKIYCWCCIICCCTVCITLGIFVVPTVVGNIISGLFTKN